MPESLSEDVKNRQKKVYDQRKEAIEEAVECHFSALKVEMPEKFGNLIPSSEDILIELQKNEDVLMKHYENNKIQI